MQIIGLILLVIGVAGSLVGTVLFLLEAFRESVVWGLACLIVPFAGLFFLLLHMDRAGKPFLISIVSIVPMFIGFLMLNDGGTVAAP